MQTFSYTAKGLIYYMTSTNIKDVYNFLIIKMNNLIILFEYTYYASSYVLGTIISSTD